MIGKIVLLAGSLFLCGAVVAEETAPTSGRFQIAPDGDGFIRLDTETGALAHCGKSEGVWRCSVVVEDRSNIDNRILALEEELAALRTNLEDMGDRLAAIEGDGSVAAPAPPTPRDRLSEEDEELDKAFSFAERMMQRFFDMIRELKNEEIPQQI